MTNSAEPSVNYEEAAVAELLIGDLEYRIDAGKQGAALCVSTRVPGAWDWSFSAEIRFDGTDVRSNVLDRPVRTELARALRAAMERTAEL